jgi:hypothetical protein
VLETQKKEFIDSEWPLILKKIELLGISLEELLK